MDAVQTAVLCCFTTAENRRKPQIPRRLWKNGIDRNHNVNVQRPSARQRQPSADKILEDPRVEPMLEPHKWEIGISVRQKQAW